MSRVRFDWSKLCPDVLASIFEGLGTNDFHRARSVCSNWYSVSRTCMRPLYPWRILFKEHSTLLFDPGEDKIHEIDHPGVDFSKSYAIASCSNWFLMVDSRLDFFLLNVFTRERINLPSVASLLVGEATFKRKDEWEHYIERSNISSCKQSAVLWVNETTRDYVVAWSYKQHYLFSYRKGDDSWWNLGVTHTQFVSMACKKKKLYVYTFDHCIKIIDLSGDSPNEIVEGNPYRDHRFHFVSTAGEYSWKRRVAITNSGEVLIVVSLKGLEDKRLFYIFKMNVGGGNWERVDSLGGEMLIFGQGVTIRAPIKEINGEGIKRDSVCCLDDDLWPGREYFNPNRRSNCGVFDVATSTITWPKPLGASFLKTCWFAPGYA